MEEKYLPIGTVCLLKGGKKRVMIIGFGIRPNENPDIIYDYLGCLFPEGVVSLEQNMVFNHDQIQTIINKGFADEETSKFNEMLKNTVAKMNLQQAPSNVPQQTETNSVSQGQAQAQNQTQNQNQIQQQDAPNQANANVATVSEQILPNIQPSIMPLGGNNSSNNGSV